jgi:hypothetical protein
MVTQLAGHMKTRITDKNAYLHKTRVLPTSDETIIHFIFDLCHYVESLCTYCFFRLLPALLPLDPAAGWRPMQCIGRSCQQASRALTPAAGRTRSRLPDGGQYSVGVVHASKLPAANLRPVQCRDRPHQQTYCVPAATGWSRLPSGGQHSVEVVHSS